MGGAKLVWLALLLSTSSTAQVYFRIDTAKRGDYSNYYQCWENAHHAEAFLQTHLPFNGKNFHPIDHDPIPYVPDSLGGDHRELNTWDSTDVYFYAIGVTSRNAGRFEYRVLLDGTTTLVPWRRIDRFSGDQERDEFEKHQGFLGGYNTTWDHYIVTQLRVKASGKILSTAVVYWQQQHPQLFNIYKTNDLAEFLEMNDFLKTVATNYDMDPRPDVRKKWLAQYKPDELDSTYGLPLHPRFQHDENSIVFYLSERLMTTTALEYSLTRDGKSMIPWKANDFDMSFVWLKDLTPGNYVLGLRFADQRHNPTAYPFTIEPAWYQTWWFRSLAVFGVVLLGGVCWLLVRLRSRAVSERRKRERLNLELKSIRSQLNPHFVFNALASIQGLVNNRQIEQANRYLSEFGSLMRETLSGGRKDFVPLVAEIATLDRYLKLEQLRFPFSYSISALPVPDAEVPSLLLQPLVENAVKHGLSGMPSGGVIEIGFTRSTTNFTCIIRDNGRGFDPAAPAAGFGLSLTRDRIQLLNEAMDDRSIDLTIESAPGRGTRIILIFQQWIS